jgi:hypothetical protein
MPWTGYPGSRNPAYGSAEWKMARTRCLRDANWRCEIRIEGKCIGTATEADHADGLANDPHHQRLRAACKPCHRYVTARQGHAAQASADPAPAPREEW